MKKRITLLTIFIIIFLIRGLSSTEVTQNPPVMHGIGEVYQYSRNSFSNYGNHRIVNAYDENNTEIYSYSDFWFSNYSTNGISKVTFLGSEYNSLVEKYVGKDNGSITPNQNTSSKRVYVRDEVYETSLNSYSYGTYEWNKNGGIIQNNSYNSLGDTPVENYYVDIYGIMYNQSYSVLSDVMFLTPGVYEMVNYIYYFDITEYIQYTLTVEVTNTMAEFTINGLTGLYSVNQVNITSEARVTKEYDVTVYIGSGLDLSSFYGTFPLIVDTTFYDSHLMYYDAVDARFLGYSYSNGIINDFYVNSTQPMYNIVNTTNVNNISIILSGSSYSIYGYSSEMTGFYPAPISEGTNRLMRGDKLEFGTYFNENISEYYETISVLNPGDFSSSWNMVNTTTVGSGNSTLEIVYHTPGSFGAFFYGDMDVYSERIYADSYGTEQYSTFESLNFFDFLPYVMSSNTQDIVVQPEPYYYAPQIPYDLPLPLYNTSVEYDQLDVSVNGYETTIAVELTVSMYYIDFSGYTTPSETPVLPTQQVNVSSLPLNVTALAYIITVFDVNTGAFIGESEVLYANYQTYTLGEFGNINFQNVSIEFENDMILQSHPYFYQLSSSTSINATTNTSANTLTSSRTTNSGSSSIITTSSTSPTNFLSAFEFTVVSFSIAGIYVIIRRRN